MITEGNIREIYDITGLTPLAGGYEFTFPYTSAQDVRVYTTGNRTDTEVSTSNYIIDESGATPKVVFIAGYSFPAGQTKLTIIRNVSYSQKLDLRNGDLIDADKLEGALDNITQQIQQVAEKVDRAILSSVSDTEPLSIPEASQRNNMLLGFDSEGKAIPVLTTDIEQKLAQALAAEESAITAKNAAENAQHEAESAQSAAETAQGKAETAQAAAESAEASSQTLLASIETKTEESIASINTTKTGAVGAVTTQQATSVAAVQAAQNTAESDIAGKRSSALTAIDTAKTTAVAAVNTQKETSVAAADREIVAKRDSALTDIQTARTNAVNAITTKKDQSLQEVEQLASEKKAEINSLAANQKADVKQYTDSVVASAKTEIDTEKTTAVTAVQEEGDAKVAIIGSSGDAEVTRVQSVYQTDLNELKGDLDELKGDVGYSREIEVLSIVPNEIYSLVCNQYSPIFENGKTYRIKVKITENVTSAYIQFSKTQSTSGVFQTFVSNTPLQNGEHEFDYIYDSSHGSTIYARIYLDGSYTKCESIKIYGFTEETLFDRVKNAELKANNAYDSSSKINNLINKVGLNKVNVLDNLSFTEGYYINKNGVATANNGYKYSAPIKMEKLWQIDIYAKAASIGYVSMLYLCEEDGTFISRLHLSSTSEYESVHYEATEECYVAVCYMISSTDSEITLYEIPDYVVDISGYLTSSMFTDIAVCGDSYTAGSIYVNGEYAGNSLECSWGKVMGRINGADVSVYASHGADTNTWQSRNGCLPQVLSDNPHQIYMLCLGINDKTYVQLGNIDDIHDDYTTNPNTYYGNYAKIIEQIKAHAPNAKIVMCKLFTVCFEGGSYYWSANAIEEIASHYRLPVIDTADDMFFSSALYENNMVGGHPTAPLYSGIGKSMDKLLSKCIQDNIGYFQDYFIN